MYHECNVLNTDYKGAVTISPSGTSLVCDRDQLELICMVTDPGSSLLEWTFTSISIFMGLHRAIEAISRSDQTSYTLLPSLSQESQPKTSFYWYQGY